MEPEVSLKLSKRADETLWGKAISNLGRVFYSSNFSVYSFLVSRRRKAALRAYNSYTHLNDYKEESKREAITEKYKKEYSNYISTLDKYITEHIYTKMQKRSATVDEEQVMAKYYAVNKYKGVDEVEHKTRLEILVLNMDWENVQSDKSEAFIEKYKAFYVHNIVELYKATMRHNAILLANSKKGDRDQYEAVYNIIDTYIKEVLPILPDRADYSDIVKDYKKYVAAIDSYEKKDFLELRKRLALLSFSKELFEFSFPVVAQEQCYKEIIEIARILITNYYTDAEKYACYEVLLDAIEEYIDNVLEYKVYWPSEIEKKEFNRLHNKMSTLKKLARIDYDCYLRKREALFIKYDLSVMKREKLDLREVRDYYRERLIICHALRRLKNKPKLIAERYTTKRRKEADEVNLAKVEDASANINQELLDIAQDNVDKVENPLDNKEALNEMLLNSKSKIIENATLVSDITLQKFKEEASITNNVENSLKALLEEHTKAVFMAVCDEANYSQLTKDEPKKEVTTNSIEKIINEIQSIADSQYNEFCQRQTVAEESDKFQTNTLFDAIMKSIQNRRKKKAKI